jgi:phosphatidyl-myo-inositol dimannoside synthase
MSSLVPAVDVTLFRPDAGGAELRERLGLANRPVVVCVSRLMPRKGQDVLVRSLPQIRRAAPDAALVLVGGGPSRGRLQRLATEVGVADHVVFSGSVNHSDLPAWYGVGDVFAMPCRERLGGLDVEGLGMVFLEAAGCGLPVVAGTSGGSVDAIRPDQTGILLSGQSVDEVASAVGDLLSDPIHAAAMGAAGRQWVSEAWSWEQTVRDFTSYLAPDA